MLKAAIFPRCYLSQDNSIFIHISQSADDHFCPFFHSTGVEFFDVLRGNVVVSIYEGEVFSRCEIQTFVSSRGDPAVLLVKEPDSLILCGKMIQNLAAFVRAAVVDYEDFQVTKGLIHDGANALFHVFFIVVNRDDD